MPMLSIDLRRFRPLAAIGVLSLGLGGCFGTDMSSVTGLVPTMGARAEGVTTGVRFLRVFVASTRPEGRGRPAPGPGEARLTTVTVTIPPNHRPGTISRPTVGQAQARRHFTIAETRTISGDVFPETLSVRMAETGTGRRDVLVFVHGFNTGYDEALFRLTQIVTDTGFTGVPVLFTWPSRESLFGYGSDREVATASRDALERLLVTLARRPETGQVHVIAHSMGTWLAMEALRQASIGGAQRLDGRLGQVMLAAPDLDVEVFRAQLARIQASDRVSLFVARDDRALQVSTMMAGDRTRLGAIDLTRPEGRRTIEALGVKVYDLTSQRQVSDPLRHGTFAEAPDVVRSIGARLTEARVADFGAAPGERAPGGVE